MNKVELAIESLQTDPSAHKNAVSVLLACLAEEFGPDVTDHDLELCMRILQRLKPDFKDD